MRFFYCLVWLVIPGLPSLSHAQNNGNFVFEGQNRTYITYVPAGYSPAQPVPLVFVLHGFTQTAQAIMGYSGFNAVADTAGFIVVYANGINNGWNTNSGFPGGSTANDVGFISALIDTMAAQYSIDPLRVYTCGFSAGGFMSHRLACELHQRIAAAGSVAGTMSSGAFNLCNPGRPVSFMQIHGTADAIVSYNGGLGNQSVDAVMGLWAQRDSCAQPAGVTLLPDLVSEGSTVERYVWSACAADTRVELLKVLNGGHTWPGAVVASGLGNTNRDISASVELWRFFSGFTLPVAVSAAAPGLDNPALLVYPNPASNDIRISTQGPDRQVQSARLYDFGGRLVQTFEFNIPASSCHLLLPAGLAGLYVLEVRLSAGQVIHARVMLNSL